MCFQVPDVAILSTDRREHQLTESLHIVSAVYGYQTVHTEIRRGRLFIPIAEWVHQNSRKLRIAMERKQCLAEQRRNRRGPR